MHLLSQPLAVETDAFTETLNRKRNATLQRSLHASTEVLLVHQPVAKEVIDAVLAAAAALAHTRSQSPAGRAAAFCLRAVLEPLRLRAFCCCVGVQR